MTESDGIVSYGEQEVHEHGTSSVQWRRVLVPTPPHSAGHRKVERLAKRDCGVAVICTLKRRGIECSSPPNEGEAGVMGGTGEWTVGVLPVSWQTGGSEKAVRERVSPTGIGPGYVCN